MTNLVIDENWQSSLEKRLIRNFSLTLANHDIQAAMSMLSDDIHLNVPGYSEAHGKDDVRALLTDDLEQADATALHIKNIFGEDTRYVVDGEWSFADGGKAAFCTLYTLSRQPSGPIIQSITTYAVILTDRVML